MAEGSEAAKSREKTETQNNKRYERELELFKFALVLFKSFLLFKFALLLFKFSNIKSG